MLFFQVIVISVIVALLRKGKLGKLWELEFKRVWLLIVPVVVIAIDSYLRGAFPKSVWVPVTAGLNVLAHLAYIVFFISNIRLKGMPWFVGGWVLNFVVVAANDMRMPVSRWAATWSKAGEVSETMLQHSLLTDATRLPFLADIIPAPAPPLITPQVASIGDVLIVVGLFALVQGCMCVGSKIHSENSGEV